MRGEVGGDEGDIGGEVVVVVVVLMLGEVGIGEEIE
jgi:hypothetical protein